MAQSSFTFPDFAIRELPNGPSLRASDLPSLLIFFSRGSQDDPHMRTA